ncbi:ABC transporter permease [candidate division KSB1 bacterium]
MPQKQRKPPFVLKLIRLFVGRDKACTLEESFSEIYNEKYSLNGRFAAYKWFWAHWLKSLPSLIKRSLYWSFVMFKSYLKVTVRNIRKQKLYSFINISGLAVGLSCCILVFFWAENKLSYDDFHENVERLYRVVTAKNTNGQKIFADRKTSFPVADALKSEFPEIENSARILKKGTKTFKYKDKVFSESGLVFIDASFFDLFTFDFLQGNKHDALKDINSVILSKSQAEKYFGSDDPLGKIITIDNRFDVVVSAVIENTPENTHFNGIWEIDCFVPLEFQSHYTEPMTQWDQFYLLTYVMLDNSADHKEVNDKLTGYLGQKDEDLKANNTEIVLHPVKDIPLYGINGERTGINRVYMYTSFALLILFIACMNYMNLSTAVLFNRGREIGIRKTLGTSRKGIIFQFVSESVVITVCSLIASFFAVFLLLPYFQDLTGSSVTFNIYQLAENLPFFLFSAFVTGIISGFIPAIIFSRFNPVGLLKTGMVKLGSRQFMRKGLVIAQIAISTALIIGTIIVYRQFSFMIHEDTKIEAENVICLYLKDSDISKNETFVNELLQFSGIEHVGTAGVIPGYWTNFATTNVQWEGKDQEMKKLFQGIYVGYDFFNTVGIPVLGGRVFSSDIINTSSYVMVNALAADLIGRENIIGRTISYGNKNMTVLGVVDNFPIWPLKYEKFPVIAEFRPERSNVCYIKTATDGPALSEITVLFERIWKVHFPDYPFEYDFLDDLNKELYGDEEQMLRVFSLIASIAIILCCLGMYGLMSFQVQNRMKEISIRKVLGARVGDLIRNLSRDSFFAVLIGNITALPTAWYFMTLWLEGYAFRISIGADIVAAGILLSCFLAILPVLPHILRSVHSNPVKYLRSE